MRHVWILGVLALGSTLWITISEAQISSSGLNTQVAPGSIDPLGRQNFDITGGTRPANGPNLFHSFGDFSVGSLEVARFLNDSGLATTNILSRVTGGNVSSIFGEIQTTNFPGANLYLINPAGVVFGATATLNVSGSVKISTADYLSLSDGVRFEAVPGPQDALLSTAPVAAFGFLGSNPASLAVQGGKLEVPNGQILTLAAGDIQITGGTLKAPSGQIQLASLAGPGEVIANSAEAQSGFKVTPDARMGTISLTQGANLDTSADFINTNSPVAAGPISILAGELVVDDSTITATSRGLSPGATVSQTGGAIDIKAQTVALSNQSTITTGVFTPARTFGGVFNSQTGELTSVTGGDITFNIESLTADNATFRTGPLNLNSANPGALTIQGLSGQGEEAHAVHLTNSGLLTTGSFFSFNGPLHGGPIGIEARSIVLNQATINAGSFRPGDIKLESSDSIQSNNSSIRSHSGEDTGGHLSLEAGRSIKLTNTTLSANAPNIPGTINLAAPTVNLVGSSLISTGPTFNLGTISNNHGGSITINAGQVQLKDGSMISTATSIGDAGNIFINAEQTFSSNGSTLNATTSQGQTGNISIQAGDSVRLVNGTVLAADNTGVGKAGNIVIEAGTTFVSRASSVSANSAGNSGGNIFIRAPERIRVVDSTVSTSAGGEGSGGNISFESNIVRLRDHTTVESTAVNGPGGTITIRTNDFRNVNSTVDARSQFGPDGSVTILP